MKPPLLGKTLPEITEIVQTLSGRADQAIAISKWLYKKNEFNFDLIESISNTLRKSLDSSYSIGKYPPSKVTESKDKTRKYLFSNDTEQQFESVFMPSAKRNTLCISSQSGCRMGCKFCLTGKIGFKGNLSVLDIVNQFYSIPDYKDVNRLVIMGMGEPFDNFFEVKKAVEIFTSQWGLAFGASNITISTVGLLDPLKQFLENPFCNLAISLNNPISAERKELMPIENTNPISEVINLIKQSPLKKPLRLSFEYVALGGVNLYQQHAVGIIDQLKGVNCHLNIICWNSHNGSPYYTPSELELNSFISCLDKNGILASVRQSRGQDIGAACGQMAGNLLINNVCSM
ncbi:MAG: 23S rRNA (adenine(2503)-C(2))-methyltransferase RlmN [Bacteroidales bacterium]|nr:23S rRNA (adenine(2503)-C(2))-methyltransferase RlmN [Bacteroidales bacterium]